MTQVNHQQQQQQDQKPAGASSKAWVGEQSGGTGYACKRCGGVSPVGVGYAVYGWRGVADESVTSCGCGYSVKQVPVLADFWRVQDKKPSDLVAVSPVSCDFALGDRVVFTNDYGVKFNLIVRGFASQSHTADHPEWAQRFIYVFNDAWWFPVAAETLALATEAQA